MVRNYREGPQWISGTIAEKRGPLTYLVEIREDILWKRHIDQIIQAADTPDDVSSCVSLPTPTVPVLPAPLPLPLTPPRYSSTAPVLPHSPSVTDATPEQPATQIQCLLLYPLLLWLNLQHRHGPTAISLTTKLSSTKKI